MFQYVIHPDAQLELENAFIWYASRSERVAHNFVNQVHQTIFTICSNPNQFRNYYKDFYELGVKKFPFSLIYIINELQNEILITSIFHHKRNPKKKYK